MEFLEDNQEENVLYFSFDLGSTVQAIQGSLGVKEEPQIVMSPEAIAAYEEELVRQAKQASLNDGVSLITVLLPNYIL